MRKEYIMVGTPYISRDIFRKVLRPLDNYSYKPTGGFWSCQKLDNIGKISEWFYYLLEERDIALTKNINQAVIFTLKEDAKILTIESDEQIESLSLKYPSSHYKLSHYRQLDQPAFDYETLSNDYDAIYVDLYKLVSSSTTRIFNQYSVNSLLLFNLNCIDTFQSTSINFDIDAFYSIPYIENISSPQKVSPHHPIYLEIYPKIKDIFLETLHKSGIENQEDYHQYLTKIVESVTQTIILTTKHYKRNVSSIQKSLQENGLPHTKNDLVRNIILNHLTDYLKDNQGHIKTLKKSPLQTPHIYTID